MKIYKVVICVGDEEALKQQAQDDEHPECAETTEKALTHAISASAGCLELQRVQEVKE